MMNKTPEPRLFHGATHDFDRDAADFDVHLHGGDAIHGTGDLEVHLAERIFEALDVGEDASASVLEDQAHRDAADMLAQRHAGIHERQRRGAHRSHRRRTVALKGLGDQSQGIGECVWRRQHRDERSLCQKSVADFAPAWTSHWPRLANRKWRKVVVVHEALERLRPEAIDALLVGERPKRGCREDLRLASREQSRAVRPRNDRDARGDGPDFVQSTTVGPQALIHNHRAQFFLLSSLHALLEIMIARVFEQWSHVRLEAVSGGLA